MRFADEQRRGGDYYNGVAFQGVTGLRIFQRPEEQRAQD
jgi:hypothetical protein